MLLGLLRQYVQPYRWAVTAVMLLQIVSTVASLYLPTLNAAIIDDGITRGNIELIAHLGLAMLAITGFQGVCAVGATYFGSRTGTGLGRDLRSAMFNNITTFSEIDVARFGAPTLLTRTTNDVRQIQVLVQTVTTVLVAAPIMCVGGIVMAIKQDATLSWLLLVSVPVLALANFLIVSRMLPVFRRMQSLIDGINRVLREQLAGIRVVRAFGQESREAQRFQRANLAISETALAAGNWQALMLPVTTLTINVSSVALIWFGGHRMESGQLQVGTLIAFLSYFMQILAAVLMATVTAMVFPRAAICAERITQVLDTRSSISAPAQPQRPAAGIRGNVSVHQACFRHQGAEQPVLEDVSFTIAAGTTTAVVGSTGSGKSTLVALICRLNDVSSGAIRIDDIDVRDFDPDVLWSAIGLVPQRGYLFAGTIADNLRYGKADATDEQMWTALRIAQADEFVRHHASGLQMPVAQGGINLSGGQRQRIAIARAIIHQPAILIFDDAFSALDVHTDANVRNALDAEVGYATKIVVSQRISTVMHADQIVVLDSGRISAVGDHDSLLATCSAYVEFVNSQSREPTIGGTS